MKTMRLVSEIIFIVALIGVVAEPGHAQFDGCGDFDQDGDQSLSDMNDLYYYLFEDGPAPESLAVMNMDGHPGLTMTDLAFYWRCEMVDWQFHVGCDACRDTLSYVTSQEDILYVRNDSIPAGTTSHIVEVWIAPETGVDAISFPFTYSCSTSTVILDSMVFGDTLGSLSPPIDTAQSRGVAAWFTAGVMTGKQRFSLLYFSVAPRPMKQFIHIDTSDWEIGHTLAIQKNDPEIYLDYEIARPALYGTSSTPPNPPSCCVGETGDVSMDGNVTLTDLAQVINMLFVTFEPVACYPEANMYGDDKCYLNLSDVSNLVNKLFITFQPVDYCDQFDNFICGQFY